ncbi:hypothetical protein N0V85_000744 [Neurospora sp. IMI 360204]|nr:hypothetical protein N0V85_000744 [Neurospora sp. IMI 360204]
MVNKRNVHDKRNMQGRRRATRSKTPCKTPKNHPLQTHQVHVQPATTAATKSPEEQILDKLYIETVAAALDAETERFKAAAERLMRLKAAIQADREEASLSWIPIFF